MLSIYKASAAPAMNMHGTTKGNGFSKSVLSLRKRQEDETIPTKLATFGLGGAFDCDQAEAKYGTGKRLFRTGTHM
jgi:hypothetical protein